MPPETIAPRLIDAYALIEEMKDLMDNENEDDEWNKPLKFALKLINSAPTVETTDDVLARLPDDMEIGISELDEGEKCFYAGNERRWAYGKTPLEAVKKLEASLNRK